MTIRYAKHGDIRIAYETVGNPQHETIIFISGLGSHLVYWTDELCQRFVDHGFHIVRFDNRDVGLSSKSEMPLETAEALIAAGEFVPPYTLVDMAADTVSVLDDLAIAAAHVVGVSLGGMIAQTMAIHFPDRVKTLTSIMSGTRRPQSTRADSGPNEAAAASVTVDVSNPETYVDLQLEGYRVTSGPHFDPVYQRDILQRSFDRCYHPAGWTFQMAAVGGTDRSEQLAQLTMPALVIHGALDPLITIAEGRHTADCIPGAKWLLIDDMGHNLPRPRWNQIADAVAQLAADAR